MTTTEDPIVEEVRTARRTIAAFYKNDLLAIAEAAARGFSDYPKGDARAKALGMTYGEYCLAEVEGTLPLCACEEPAGYNAGASSGGDVAAAPK